MKLESIAHTNGIKNFTAHDAMGDTYACLELAKLIKNQIPELWSKSISQRNKTKLEEDIAYKPLLFRVFLEKQNFSAYHCRFSSKYKWLFVLIYLKTQKKF